MALLRLLSPAHLIGEHLVPSRIHSRKNRRDGLNAAARKPAVAQPAARPHNDPPDPAAPQRTRLTIGRLAKRTDASLDTIRFYEKERLLQPAGKTAAGYRLYGEDAVQRLEFIKHAQQCGMTLAEIRQLLDLKADDSACCRDVRSLAVRKKLRLEQKIKDMTAMSRALSRLIEVCTGEQRPLMDCPILAALDSSVSDPASRIAPNSKP